MVVESDGLMVLSINLIDGRGFICVTYLMMGLCLMRFSHCGILPWISFDTYHILHHHWYM